MVCPLGSSGVQTRENIESYKEKCDLRPYDVEVVGDALESNRWGLNSGPVPSVGPASCAKPVTWGHEGITKLMPGESTQAYASCMVNSA